MSDSTFLKPEDLNVPPSDKLYYAPFPKVFYSEGVRTLFHKKASWVVTDLAVVLFSLFRGDIHGFVRDVETVNYGPGGATFLNVAMKAYRSGKMICSSFVHEGEVGGVNNLTYPDEKGNDVVFFQQHYGFIVPALNLFGKQGLRIWSVYHEEESTGRKGPRLFLPSEY